MEKFLRENFVLALGIALPLLLILAFAGHRLLINIAVAAPQHAVVIAHETYNRDDFETVIDGGALKISYFIPVADAKRNTTNDRLTLYLFDPLTGRTERAVINAPDDAKPGRRRTLPVPAPFDGLELNAAALAPDDYALENAPRRRNGSLFAEIFSSGRHDRRVRLSKGRRHVIIPDIQSGPAPELIGWVMRK